MDDGTILGMGDLDGMAEGVSEGEVVQGQRQQDDVHTNLAGL